MSGGREFQIINHSAGEEIELAVCYVMLMLIMAK